ncbi:MAG: hypothetical protein FWD73_10905, partial [Polyangiaceae bacterium]|nr:hypothetical protein [Polyangiaceae bacterium]
MSNWIDSVSLRARETFTQAEEGAHNAISKVKEEASAVASKAKEAATKMDRWIETSEPSKAADDYTAANVVAAAQAQASTPPSHHPAIMPFPLPVRKPGDLLHEPKELLNKSGELL